MRRDQLVFLVVGLAFGALLGFAGFHAFLNEPAPVASGSGAGGPRGPAPMTGSVPAPAESTPPGMQQVRALKQRLDADPQDLEAAVGLANLYHDVQMWEQAIDYYELAVELRPDDPDLLTDLGYCKQAIGQYDAALDLFARSREIDPGHWQSVYNTIVVAGLQAGRFDVAEEAIDRIEEIAAERQDVAAQVDPRLPQIKQAIEEAKAKAAGASG